ncbi:hypothetical protein EKO27_g3828 [Xylaria grammica]|uniref:DUF7909 domain-containing protein n=1 Tax=Xylaria grammica TaxID=363999 RepID=A0A439DA35_9PEZI|nr:hypothetical protein EKO27_g3828 [Xylaria grammica]GAW21921.1 hypothetical protein ANO14919_114480 [Xylariales sp. No.14919]
MQQSLALWLASTIAATSACTLPTAPALSNNITEGFSLQVQNASNPDIHNHFLNIWDWGGGDQHLFVSPAGNSTNELQLIDGVITLSSAFWDPPRRAVINGEYEPLDNTTKMFMTERGDPRAIWDVVYGCNPDTDEVQVQLAFKSRDTELGGRMGVRPFNGNYDFRWKGPGTSVNDPNRPWTGVTLAVVYNRTLS